MGNYRQGLAALVMCAAMAGCGPYVSTREDNALRAHEAPKLDHFVERENIARRQKLYDDPNAISFVYGLSDLGNVLFMDVAKGKVSSSTKRLEPVSGRPYNTSSCNGYTRGDVTICTDELMQVDGTYGSSDPYVFWFTPEGTYRQWSGKYLTSSVPIKLREPVMNFSDIDRDLQSRVQGAYEALKAGKTVTDDLKVKQ